MLPPFPPVGLRPDLPDPRIEERRVLRRGAPERLRLDLPAPGWPPVFLRAEPFAPPDAPAPPAGGWVGRIVRGVRLAAPA